MYDETKGGDQMANRKVRSLETRMAEAKEKMERLELRMKIKDLQQRVGRRRRPRRL